MVVYIFLLPSTALKKAMMVMIVKTGIKKLSRTSGLCWLCTCRHKAFIWHYIIRTSSTCESYETKTLIYTWINASVWNWNHVPSGFGRESESSQVWLISCHNMLAYKVVAAPSLNMLKRRLDYHWRNETFLYNYKAPVTHAHATGRANTLSGT